MKVTMVDTKTGKQKTMPASHAKILHKLGRATYMTRDLQAGPATLRLDGPTVSEFVAAGYRAKNYPPAGYAPRSTADEIAAAIDAQEAPPPVELDSAGHRWDEKLHVATKLKNGDGTWRKRPGARAAD